MNWSLQILWPNLIAILSGNAEVPHSFQQLSTGRAGVGILSMEPSWLHADSSTFLHLCGHSFKDDILCEPYYFGFLKDSWVPSLSIMFESESISVPFLRCAAVMEGHYQVSAYLVVLVLHFVTQVCSSKTEAFQRYWPEGQASFPVLSSCEPQPSLSAGKSGFSLISFYVALQICRVLSWSYFLPQFGRWRN